MKLTTKMKHNIADSMTADLSEESRQLEIEHHRWILKLHLRRLAKELKLLIAQKLPYVIGTSDVLRIVVDGETHLESIGLDFVATTDNPEMILKGKEAQNYLKNIAQLQDLDTKIHSIKKDWYQKLESIQTLEDLQKHFPEAVPFLDL